MVGIVGVISAVIREVLLRQPDGGQSGDGHIEAAFLDNGSVRAAQTPLCLAPEFLHGLVAHVQVGGLFQAKRLGIDVGILGENALLMAGNQHRGKKPLFIVVQSLPTAKVVDAGPAGYRPAVVELPDHRTHAAAPVPPPVLDTVLHGLCLQQLGGVYQQLQTAGIQVHLG